MLKQDKQSILGASINGFRKAWRINPELTLFVVFSLIGLAISVIGISLDHRFINGELAWIKPFKFSLSLTLYGGSLIFISSLLHTHRLLLKITSIAALVGCVVELSAIVLQVMRGAASHFNLATPFDATLWVIIKAAIMPVSLAIILMLVMLLRQRNLPPVLGSAICWGALLTVVGFIPGALMLLPESLQHVFTVHQMIGHNVGQHLPGSSIPYLGWSTIAGDLRVAHFIGLHALQVIPLLGFLINKSCSGLSLIRQQALVSISGYSYFALILLLTFQALLGESMVSPGAETIHLLLLLASCTIFGVGLVLLPEKTAAAIMTKLRGPIALRREA